MSIRVSKNVQSLMRTNTYFVSEGDSRDCIVIDPSLPEPTLAYLSEYGLVPRAVVLTHGHFDHICGAAALQQMGARVYIHRLDGDTLSDPRRSMAHFVRARQTPITADILLEDGDTFDEAGITFGVIHTPGHTPGGISLVFPDNILFSGDTLFADCYGRYDFEGGDPNALYDSIVNKLFALEGDYTVYPGHDRSTTLGYERQHNSIYQLIR